MYRIISVPRQEEFRLQSW